ncbi:lysylphosphatidylglycerol synthase transmembrane domain-containing protein [Bradyrhizobium frederickii]|uniref:lysylphosphatidylglycerol synthase transmembrane domain-containing protein n=1 Tax=Bradyrhizobium frederickii TaxID=2560054 RepID=UPI001431F38F|nr:lysylphosphatidylglycerol synthase transmembrane domain-containing protein [Bradyrhizobium frederickii]
MKNVRILLSMAALVAAIALVLYNSDVESLKLAARNISIPTVVEISATIAIGYLIASARVRTLAAYSGHSLGFRQAVAAVSVGQIAANLFFQVVGQVIARGLLFSRAGIPLATTVVITGYERLFALIVSILLAASGALYLFGVISVDAQTGGYDLAKLFVGAILALVSGAWLGWGQLARSQLPKFDRGHIDQFAVALVLSAAIQLSTMTAYVFVAHALAPKIPLLHVAAAASIVMLAASLPISLAGWGIREVSAVFALGAVGLSPGESLVSAVTIGISSLLVAAVLAGISHRAWRSTGAVSNAAGNEAGRDFGSVLANWLPIAAATAVAFQVYLPSGTGRINVNFADPIAILGGALFAIWHIRDRAWPNWRVPFVNGFLIFFSIDTLIALTNGYVQMGWTSWAFTNKGAGWLVLVAYFFVGAMIASLAEKKGFNILLGTFVGAVTAIAALDLFLLVLRSAAFPIPETLLPFRISGFAQNPNAFGFQLLLAIAATAVLDLGRLKRAVIAATLFAAIWFSGSRASFGSALVLAAVAPWAFWGMSRKAVGRGAVIVGGLAVLTLALLLLLNNWTRQGDVLYSLLYNQDGERFQSISGGLSLFLSNPIIGDGLGAFVHDYAMQTGDFLPIHSTPIWLLAEYGLIGFATIFGAAAYLWKRAISNAWTGDPIDRFVVLVLTVFATMSVAHEMLYQRSLWLLLGAALATHGSFRAAVARST